MRDKLLKEEDLDVPKVVEKLRQNTFDKKKKRKKRTPYRKHYYRSEKKN